MRVDNVTDRAYIGSVIVADGNGRFYEPAPGRALMVGATLQLTHCSPPRSPFLERAFLLVREVVRQRRNVGVGRLVHHRIHAGVDP